MVMPEDMHEVLETLANQSAQVPSEVSIPPLMGAWTKELQSKLSCILDIMSSQSKRVSFSLPTVPATSSIRNRSVDSDRSDARGQLWKLWRHFIASAPSLQELEISNLSEKELFELHDTVRGHCPQLQKLILNGRGISLDTLTELILRLSNCPVKAFMKFTLYNGEEYSAHAVSKLARAVTRNYMIEKLDVACSEYSAFSSEDLGGVHPDPCQTIASILALNRAGRRYLLQDTHNLHKGVKVIGHEQVNADLNAIFIHVRENPSLCACEGQEQYQQHFARGVGDSQNGNCSCGTKRKCSECWSCLLDLSLYVL